MDHNIQKFDHCSEIKNTDRQGKTSGQLSSLKRVWAILFLYLVQVVENPIIPMKVQNKMKSRSWTLDIAKQTKAVIENGIATLLASADGD